ncbi:DUF4376 domain-containing protein, partial [Escherichia coli]|uniref:DUF4376 domain-containing protein n=1 Tax=Escherichia coli TaxID=562 RepID=UPI003B5B8B10
EFVPYTAMQDDSAPTGQRIWEELQSGKWGEIAPFTVTPELIELTRCAKLAEISAWRDVQESGEFVFEYNGHNWDGGKASQSRLSPVVAAAAAGMLPEGFFWTDADNMDVVLTPTGLAELDAAMTTAMVVQGFRIHECQRRMKEEVVTLQTLEEIRAYRVGWPGVAGE